MSQFATMATNIPVTSCGSANGAICPLKAFLLQVLRHRCGDKQQQSEEEETSILPPETKKSGRKRKKVDGDGNEIKQKKVKKSAAAGRQITPMGAFRKLLSASNPCFTGIMENSLRTVASAIAPAIAAVVPVSISIPPPPVLSPNSELKQAVRNLLATESDSEEDGGANDNFKSIDAAMSPESGASIQSLTSMKKADDEESSFDSEDYALWTSAEK